jgi:MFS transporter, NNP family, nitrate/nitrite transporter
VGHPRDWQKRHLLLGTVLFTVCFAAWGLISAFAPHFRQQFHLSATQTAFLVAVPVLLGDLARIPIGMLADRFGGRAGFTVLMFLVAVPGALVPAATDHRNLLIVAFLLGMAGSSFPVGVGYVSRWFSMERQGSALGVYGLGNIGQSAAVFLGPAAAAAYGLRAVYLGNVHHSSGLGGGVRHIVDYCLLVSPEVSDIRCAPRNSWSVA